MGCETKGSRKIKEMETEEKMGKRYTCEREKHGTNKANGHKLFSGKLTLRMRYSLDQMTG